MFSRSRLMLTVRIQATISDSYLSPAKSRWTSRLLITRFML